MGNRRQSRRPAPMLISDGMKAALSSFVRRSAPVLLGVGLVAVIVLLAFGVRWDKLLAKPAPPKTDNQFLLAEYYFNHGPDADGTYDLSQARQYYEAALKDNPRGSNTAWYQLGRIDFLEGKFDAAIEKFNRQIEYFGDETKPVYYMLGLTYGYRARREGSFGDWPKAEDNFSRYLELDPESPWAKVDLAWIYFSQGKFAEMIPVLEKGLETHPENPWLLNMYGLALLNTGETEEARQRFALARLFAVKLTPADWGRSYPGNDPSAWADGLREFQTAIEKNIELAGQ